MSQSMIPSSAKTLTFEEYRFYQGEPDVRYELFRGRLIPMATPTLLHTSICHFLVYQFQRYFATKNLSLVVATNVGVRTEKDSSRIPDVMVCTQSLWEQVLNRPGAGILDLDEAPALVVEVVSENWREDYIRKRAEYALIDILEYWIVDPLALLSRYPQRRNPNIQVPTVSVGMLDAETTGGKSLQDQTGLSLHYFLSLN